MKTNVDFEIMGRRIKEFRAARRLSQADLAAKVNIAPSYMSRIETAVNAPSLSTFMDIANALGITANELIGDTRAAELSLLSIELAEILTDCDDYERHFILEIARAVKKIFALAKPRK